MVGRACLVGQLLATLLCDCEVVVYARPLTYKSCYEFNFKLLTPSSFLPDVHKLVVPDCDS